PLLLRPPCSSLLPYTPLFRSAPSLWLRLAPSVLHHAPLAARLHLAAARRAPVARASDALHFRATRSSALPLVRPFAPNRQLLRPDRQSTRLNSSHVKISYAVF